MTDYAHRHKSDPDPADPGFCRCGLGLDAWFHTDTTKYVEVPLGRGHDRPLVSEEVYVPCLVDDETCQGQVTAARLCDVHRDYYFGS